MNFEFVERIDTSTYIEFYTSDAIQDIHKISEIKEYNVYNDFKLKQFKYSFDNIYWSEYINLSADNLSYINIKDNKIWLSIKYTQFSNTDASIASLYLIYK